MDLLTRKLTFGKDFLTIQNDKDFIPMTLDEFNKRIDQSMLNSKNGNLIDNDDLIKEIEKWG